MAYVTNPNLPSSRVRGVFADSRISPKCKAGMESYGITTYALAGSGKLAYPVASHPDMVCMHLGGKKWLFNNEVYEKNKLLIDCLFLDIKLCRESLSANYPLNVLYNGCIIGRNIICKETSLSVMAQLEASTQKMNIINVKQGYAKCSVCVVDERSIITSDFSIQEAAQRNGLDALLIQPGYIKLDGYDYGFIGGCSFKADKNTLAFTGDIKKHPDYKKILGFTKAKKVDIISISDEPLYDYGSVLPIIQD